MVTKEQFQAALTIVKIYKKQLLEELKAIEENIITPDTHICDIECISNRTFTALWYAKVVQVKDITSDKLKMFRGKKTLKEINEVIVKAGLK